MIEEFVSNASRNVRESPRSACGIRGEDSKDDRRVAVPVMTGRVSNSNDLAAELRRSFMHFLIEIFQARQSSYPPSSGYRVRGGSGLESPRTMPATGAGTRPAIFPCW